jgi:hypothetical protein
VGASLSQDDPPDVFSATWTWLSSFSKNLEMLLVVARVSVTCFERAKGCSLMGNA